MIDLNLAKICCKFNFNPEDIFSKCQDQETTEKKDICVYLLRTVHGYSLKELSEIFNAPYASLSRRIKRLSKKIDNYDFFENYLREMYPNYKTIKKSSELPSLRRVASDLLKILKGNQNVIRSDNTDKELRLKRAILVYLLHEIKNFSIKELCDLFDISNSSVSNNIKKVRLLMAQNNEFKKGIDKYKYY